MTRWLNRLALPSGVVGLLEENRTADYSRPTCVEVATLHAPICRFRMSMPLCYLGAATDGKIFRPFSRPLQSKIVFPVSHPILAFLYQFDFFRLVLVPIMHEILATER